MYLFGHEYVEATLNLGISIIIKIILFDKREMKKFSNKKKRKCKFKNIASSLSRTRTVMTRYY